MISYLFQTIDAVPDGWCATLPTCPQPGHYILRNEKTYHVIRVVHVLRDTHIETFVIVAESKRTVADLIP